MVGDDGDAGYLDAPDGGGRRPRGRRLAGPDARTGARRGGSTSSSSCGSICGTRSVPRSRSSRRWPGRSSGCVPSSDGTSRAATRPVDGVRAVDTATAPDVQRLGIFSRLTTEALEVCRADAVALVFNTPNDKSLPGYVKMGWRLVASGRSG